MLLVAVGTLNNIYLPTLMAPGIQYELWPIQTSVSLIHSFVPSDNTTDRCRKPMPKPCYVSTSFFVEKPQWYLVLPLCLENDTSSYPWPWGGCNLHSRPVPDNQPGLPGDPLSTRSTGILGSVQTSVEAWRVRRRRYDGHQLGHHSLHAHQCGHLARQ